MSQEVYSGVYGNQQGPVDPVTGETLTDHSYDGIQEYDNPLPGWWKFLFWVSIIFSPIYYFFFHAGPESRTIYGQYESQKAKMMQVRFKDIGELTGDKETLLKYMKDKDWLSVGQSVYQTNCVSCHGAKGEGVVGPNLTDDLFKNVTNIEDIVKVIDQGAANGAMPAWGKRLSHPNLIVLTAAYVASMRGNSVPGRLPEGNEIPPWE
jgi:cytochrome c oxidase cbb3-type subunit 3